MGIGVTILSAVSPPLFLEVQVFIPPGRARSFVIVCLCFLLPLMVSCKDIALMVTALYIPVAYLKFHLKRDVRLDMY